MTFSSFNKRFKRGKNITITFITTFKSRKQVFHNNILNQVNKPIARKAAERTNSNSNNCRMSKLARFTKSKIRFIVTINTSVTI